MISFSVGSCTHKNRLKQFASAAWDGRTYWSIGQGSCADVAALLRGAGCPDGPWVATDAAHETLFKGTSLHALANAAPGNKPADPDDVVRVA